MRRRYKHFLHDMLDAASRIVDVCRGLDVEKLQADRDKREAVLFNFHVLGEAAKQIPAEFRDAHTGIQWRLITAMRDKIAHSYFGIKWDVVWSTIVDDLPLLIAALEPALEGIEFNEAD